MNKKAFAAFMLRLSALCTACPEIEELDLNLVLAHPEGIDILDARILLNLNNKEIVRVVR